MTTTTASRRTSGTATSSVLPAPVGATELREVRTGAVAAVFTIATTVLTGLALVPIVGGWLPDASLAAVIPLAQLIPLLVAIVLHQVVAPVGARPRARLGEVLAIRTSWSRLSWGLALATIAALSVPIGQLVIATMAGWSPWGPSPQAKAVVATVPVLALVAAVSAIGEELGWRGYLQSITARWGFWRSAAVVSVAWTAFHLPLMAFYVTTDTMSGRAVVAALLNIAFASFALSALCDRMGSVWPAVWAHGLLNTAVIWLHSTVGGVGGFGPLAFWVFTALGWVGWLVTAAVIRRHPDA